MLSSTRRKLNIRPSEAVVKGISDDGGLFIFENFENFKFTKEFLVFSYQELAEKILCFVFDDFSKESIHEIVTKAYSENNFDVPVKLSCFSDVSFLELWHGPTFAFKDMALTILGRLMEQAKSNINEKEKTIILTATSGDTGSATLSGFDGIDINAIVLYPHGGVSRVQEAQMQYFAKNGSRAIAVEQNFDFCQSLVKKVFTDSSVKLEGAKFSSANSINIGRLVPQIVYYFYSYLELVRRGEIVFGEEINFSVPTGNFGDILAGYLAKCMGLPIYKLICASNKNDVLTDFFHTGIYNRQRSFYKTISPSMDILISSNLERLLYLITDGNAELVAELMEDLKQKGEYKLPEKYMEKLSIFYAEKQDDAETKENIKQAFEDYSYLIDPHTAVAYGALRNYERYSSDGLKSVVISTASPYKFPDAVADALNIDCKENIFDTIDEIERVTNAPAPKGIKSLRNFKFEREVWSAEQAEYNLKKLVGDKNIK